MVDVQNWEIRKIGDKEFLTRERFFQQTVRFFLVASVVQIKHSAISGTEISDPAKSDVSLHQSSVSLTQLAQVVITGKDDPFFRRQWRVPWRLACDRANAFMQFALV